MNLQGKSEYYQLHIFVAQLKKLRIQRTLYLK